MNIEIEKKTFFSRENEKERNRKQEIAIAIAAHDSMGQCTF